MGDMPTKEELDAVERCVNGTWAADNLNEYFKRDVRLAVAAARTLHRIRQSPGLTAEQRERIEKERDSAFQQSHQPQLCDALASLLAAYDSQAAALADLERENHLFRHGLKEADAADCRRVVTTALESLAERDAEIAKLKSIIDTNDLCHNLHGTVDARAFADGCSQEQRKLYGCSPDADQRDEFAQLISLMNPHCKDFPFPLGMVGVYIAAMDRAKELSQARAGGG